MVKENLQSLLKTDLVGSKQKNQSFYLVQACPLCWAEGSLDVQCCSWGHLGAQCSDTGLVPSLGTAHGVLEQVLGHRAGMGLLGEGNKPRV